MASKWDSSFDVDEPGLHGVEVDIVCKNVPVVSLDKASDFEENAAWMIQSACDSSGKADALYEYCHDDDILSECRRLGMGKDEVCIVRLRDNKQMRAVGASGKRSTMLACVIAMSIDDPEGLEGLWDGLRSYKLHRQYYDIMEMVYKLVGGRKVVSRGEISENMSSSAWDGYSKGAKRSRTDDGLWQPKPSKRDDDDDDHSFKKDRYGDCSSTKPKSARRYDGVYDGEDSGGKVVKSWDKWSLSGDDWGSYASPHSGGGRGGASSKKQQWGPSTAQALDDQLASYFDD